ncbi:MAG: D-sedoheptulose 7-phosphate isomerase [Rhodospirillales bacterium]|nr:D-sedoheptulose 7-phosphate isomerase [Rhodospirillales bacterium]
MTTFDLEKFWISEAHEHEDVAEKTFATLQNHFEQMLNACLQSIEGGGKILFFGNGGSAADAQHLATELTVRYVNDRAPIPAIALTTDTSTLTAIGNDFGFDDLFARQVDALGKKRDVAIGISTSGNSSNILKGLKMARDRGLTTVGLSGRDGGKMRDVCDILLIVPSNTTARIQEMHIMLGHMLCGALEKKLNLA